MPTRHDDDHKFNGDADFSDGKPRVPQSTADIATAATPTDAELDSAFGTPAVLGDGFVAVLDDNGAGSNAHICAVINGAWWYAAMTKAA